jgi:single-strand DNA-binding protein
MRSINKVILVGHIAADPEHTITKAGRSRTVFPLATHRETTSDGEKKDVTDFHRIIAFGKLADVCGRFLAKGAGVYIEGQILNRAYEKDGERKYVTEIRVDELNLLSYRKKDGIAKVTRDELPQESADSSLREAGAESSIAK